MAIKMTNSKLIAKFNAEVEADNVDCVCQENYPYINDRRAVFYRDSDSQYGWMILTTKSSSGGSKDYAVRIPPRYVSEAQEIEYDCYDTAGYAIELLDLAGSICDR